MNTLNDELVQSPLHLVHSFFSILAVTNQLCNHTVVIRRNHALSVLRCVNSNTIAARRIKRRDFTRTWCEFFWMLCIDATFNGVTAYWRGGGHNVLQSFPRGDS